MSETSTGKAMFVKQGNDGKAVAPPDPSKRVGPVTVEAPPGIPPELLAAIQAQMGQAPGVPPELAQMLGALPGVLPSLMPTPLELKQRERRDLAKALLLSLAHNEVVTPKNLAHLALEQADKLIDALDELDAEEQKETK